MMNTVRSWRNKSSLQLRAGVKGFTLLETLITAGILMVTVVGLMELFAYCAQLSEMAGNLTSALSEAQDKMEEIRNHTYADIATDYVSGGSPGNTFNLTQLTGKGVIYVDASNTDLLKIEIDVSWRNNRTDRVVGEDLDLDGIIDTGEDVDSDGKLDSPVKLITYIAEK